MEIVIDTQKNTCKITFCQGDTKHIKNLLLVKQAVTMANPDSHFSIHIEEGWEMGALGELEELAQELAFDIAMKHGDIHYSGPREMIEKFQKLQSKALSGTEMP